MVIAARAMQAGINLLKPYLVNADVKSACDALLDDIECSQESIIDKMLKEEKENWHV